MEDQQTTDYIRKHLAEGHTEANLRKHFLSYGWSQAKVDAAFKHYHRSKSGRSAKKPKKTRAAARPRRGSKWPKRLLVLCIAAILAIIVHYVLVALTTHKPAPPAAQHLTTQQQQTFDVNTVGGAVGQYAVANGGVLPTRITAAPGGAGVVLCGATCDVANWQVTLRVYKPSNVKLVPYAPGLTAPDQDTMYLVPGARCKSNAIDNQNVGARSMAIVYAKLSGSGLAQHCLNL